MQHNSALKLVGRTFGDFAVFFNYFAADAFGARFKCACDAKPDIAATHHHHTFLFAGGFTENLQRPVQVLRIAKHIDFIAGKQLIRWLRREQPPVAPDADHDGLQGGEQIGELTQRGFEHRAVFFQRDAHQLRAPAQKRLGVKCRGRCQPAQRRFGHFAFRADHHINWHVFAAVKVGIDRGEIRLAAQPGNFTRYRKH